MMNCFHVLPAISAGAPMIWDYEGTTVNEGVQAVLDIAFSTDGGEQLAPSVAKAAAVEVGAYTRPLFGST